MSFGDDVRTRRFGDGTRMVASIRDGSHVIVDEHADISLLADELVPQDRLGRIASAWRSARRRFSPTNLDYLILVPTLRCNLSCSYCQVSRAPASSTGFDWTNETLLGVLDLIDRIDGPAVKIEFQGGEPTLRPDLINAVIARCERFPVRSFVICTNLEILTPEIETLIARPDVHISTSLDGDISTHTRQRAGSSAVRDNLRCIIDRHGSSKVSALPTINAEAPPDIDSLLDAYASFGLSSVFLRPITYHGFARKRHASSRDPDEHWWVYHRAFVERIIARNWAKTGPAMEEAYLSICLRRILQPGKDRHVDLRQPNPIGVDYVVIDHDGTVYPTDEARMLARSRVINLAIGTVKDGWHGEIRTLLDAHSTNDGDPDCESCAYQAYCGRDVIDDLARYGTIDLPRHETAFCRRHLHMFDLAFELLDSDDPSVRYSLAQWLHVPGEMRMTGLVA